MKAYYLETEEYNMFAVVTGEDHEALIPKIAEAVSDEFCIEGKVTVTLSGSGEHANTPFTAACEYINDEGDEEIRDFTLFNTTVY